MLMSMFPETTSSSRRQVDAQQRQELLLWLLVTPDRSLTRARVLRHPREHEPRNNNEQQLLHVSLA